MMATAHTADWWPGQTTVIEINLIKGSNGTTINIFLLNTYHKLNTNTEKHFLKHKYLRIDKGQKNLYLFISAGNITT